MIHYKRDGRDWKVWVQWAPDIQLIAYGYTLSEAVKDLGARMMMQESRDVRDEVRANLGLEEFI